MSESAALVGRRSFQPYTRSPFGSSILEAILGTLLVSVIHGGLKFGVTRRTLRRGGRKATRPRPVS